MTATVTCPHCGATFDPYGSNHASFVVHQSGETVWSCGRSACLRAHGAAYAAECAQRQGRLGARQLAMTILMTDTRRPTQTWPREGAE